MPRAIPVGALVVYHDNGPPSTSDDSATIRARRGYWWVDALAGDFWLCVDPAEGAAVWYRLGNAEDLASIALSGSWDDLGDTPTTLAGYGITDAVPDSRAISTGTGLEGGGDLSEDRTLSLSAGTLDSLGRADSAVQPEDLGSAAFESATAFDAAGAASAAESNANSYTDNAINALGSAAHEHVGTQPLELPRNTELASGAFAPYEAHSLYPILPTGSRTLTPDDNGKIVWSVGHNVTLPDSAAPGMQPGWRVWIKNTHGASSLTIDCGAGDTIDGGASLSLAAGESVLIVMIADGEFGSL